MATTNYYADSAAGGGGDGLAWGTAWTFAEAVAADNGGTVVKGDIVNFRGSFTPGATILTGAGDADEYIAWIGCGTTVGDGEYATITGVAIGATNLITTAAYRRYENFILDATDNGGGIIGGAASAIVVNCEGIAGGAGGAYALTVGASQNCYFHDGSGHAINSGRHMNCIFENYPTLYGVYGCWALVNCVFKNVKGMYNNQVIANCIYDGLSGIMVYAYISTILMNTIFINNASATEAIRVMTLAGVDVPDAILTNINYWNVTNISDRTDLITNLTNLNPGFVDAPNFDYRITNPALRGIGLSKVGLLNRTEDYEITPGVDQVAITLPDDGEVISPTAFGWDMDADAGEYVETSEDDVRDGTTFGDENANTGNLGLPAEAEVLDAVGYGTNDTEHTGNVVQPSVNDVQEAVTFGPSSGLTGVFGSPAETEVEDGVGYGANDTESTGNLEIPAVEDVELGVTYGPNGSLTGTLEAVAVESPFDLTVAEDSLVLEVVDG